MMEEPKENKHRGIGSAGTHPTGHEIITARTARQRQRLAAGLPANGISPKMRTFARAVAGGTDVGVAAKSISVAAATVRRWMAQPWWAKVEDEERNFIVQSPVKIFSPMLSKSVEVYERALQTDDLPLGVRVAENVFDRVFGKPSARDTNPTPIVPIQIIISSPPPTEGSYKLLDGGLD